MDLNKILGFCFEFSKTLLQKISLTPGSNPVHTPVDSYINLSKAYVIVCYLYTYLHVPK